MSLVHAALAYGRQQAQTRFTETVTAGRYTKRTDPQSGKPVWELDGEFTYAGPGQVKYPSLNVSDSTVTSQPVAEQQITVKLPSGTVLETGEHVVVVASTVDASLVGCRYRVDGAGQKGQTTSARYPVVELS